MSCNKIADIKIAVLRDFASELILTSTSQYLPSRLAQRYANRSGTSSRHVTPRMWHAKIAEDQWSLLQGIPKRQLCKADCSSAAQPFTLADHHDTDPLAGSDWRAQFQLVQRLSSGTYGFVWRCLDRASELNLAIKFIARDKNTIDKNVEREIINHSGLMHPHIIEFKICFLTDKYLAIAMEYANGEDMLRQGYCISFFLTSMLAIMSSILADFSVVESFLNL